MVASAGQERLAKEQDTTTVLPSATEAIAAWRKWYGEAVRSVGRLVVGPATPAFDEKVRALAAPFDVTGRWQMADGRWQMADGRWQMADGRWQMADEGGCHTCGAKLDAHPPQVLRYNSVPRRTTSATEK